MKTKLKPILILPLLIFLTVANSGCKTTAPQPPHYVIKQPIINVTVTENGVKKKLNACKFWKYEGSEWVLIETKPLEACNGIFGITSSELTDYRDYARQLEKWIGRNCGTGSN